LPVLIVVFCQVEVSATDWSLVQRSPTDCGASLCVIKKPRKQEGYSPARGLQNTNPQWVVAPVEKKFSRNTRYEISWQSAQWDEDNSQSLFAVFRHTHKNALCVEHVRPPVWNVIAATNFTLLLCGLCIVTGIRSIYE